MAQIQPIQSKQLTDQNVLHGFFTRSNGVSKGIYESLNVGLGSDDERENVLENRNRICGFFDCPHDHLITPFQVHSSSVAIADKSWDTTSRPKVDGVVTKDPNIAIGILTADCGPVLFYDEKNKVIGAAHAGWKGAVGGILENTVQAMIELGSNPSEITAVLGPTIGQSNYEVGPEFVAALLSLTATNEKYFIPSSKPDHSMFDLPGFVTDKLQALGVSASWTGHCTYENEADFFSYRRTTHRSEPDYGRQISAISLKRMQK